MKTKKFVGKINGKVYNDVVEYKKALMNIDTTKSYTISCEYTDVEEENKEIDTKKEEDEKKVIDINVILQTPLKKEDYENEDIIEKTISNIEDLTSKIDIMEDEDMEKMSEALFDIAEKFDNLMGRIEYDRNRAVEVYKELDDKKKTIEKKIEEKEKELSMLNMVKEGVCRDLESSKKVAEQTHTRWENIQKVDEAYVELSETFLEKLEKVTGKNLKHCIV